MSSLTTDTFSDLLVLALKNAGVVGTGQTPLAQDINDACQLLNNMISQWQERRWLVYRLRTMSVPCNASQSYSIGPGGDIPVVQRPSEINSAFARQTVNNVPNQIDYPISILPARETYNQISMKSLQSFPQYGWYDADTPLGYFYVYPVITSQFTLHLTFREQLQSVVFVDDDIEFPAVYKEALMYNLAVRLAGAYMLPVSPVVESLARASLATIRQINAQVPRMGMPKGLVNPPHYNIFSDSAY